MGTSTKSKRHDLHIPTKLYHEAKVISIMTGESLTGLCNRALHAIVSEEKKRLNETIVSPDVLKSMRDYEVETGISPKEQFTQAVKYWFRVRKINEK